ncbi:MAG TPA: crossover junction endodeoxyribonuclease RuvC [Polyangiaceae bacterium]|nr:crossover junction endodeoxyribonuclease RuvC [Polyangiaceae bacterium]
MTDRLVLGIDPGTRKLGWGLVVRRGQRLEHVAHGVLCLDAEAPLAERLCEIDEGLADVIERHRPQVGSVESLFFHKDAQAAAKLGHARGVVLLAFARAKLPVFEYAPALVKRTVAGKGQAAKEQVAMVIKAMLGLRETPPADAADALAIAVTHLRAAAVAEAVSQSNRARPVALRLKFANR